MSLLKKIKPDLDQDDKDLLSALDVDKTIDEVLTEMEQGGTIKLQDPIPNPDENQNVQEAK